MEFWRWIFLCAGSGNPIVQLVQKTHLHLFCSNLYVYTYILGIFSPSSNILSCQVSWIILNQFHNVLSTLIEFLILFLTQDNTSYNNISLSNWDFHNSDQRNTKSEWRYLYVTKWKINPLQLLFKLPKINTVNFRNDSVRALVFCLHLLHFWIPFELHYYTFQARVLKQINSSWGLKMW